MLHATLLSFFRDKVSIFWQNAEWRHDCLLYTGGSLARIACASFITGERRWGKIQYNFLPFYPEAKFLDIIGTKVLRVFLLAIHSHLYYIYLPPPPSKTVKIVCNVNTLSGNLNSENSPRLCLETLNEIIPSWILLQYTITESYLKTSKM